jgi:hypothetical protein
MTTGAFLQKKNGRYYLMDWIGLYFQWILSLIITILAIGHPVVMLVIPKALGKPEEAQCT